MKNFPFVVLRAPMFSLNQISRFDLNDTYFLIGLYLASKDFFEKVQDSLVIKYDKKVRIALQKYWLRACTRPTPYGLFAGILRLNVSEEETRIILDHKNTYLLKVRLDFECLMKIHDLITKNPVVKNNLKYFPNRTIYAVDDRLRYVEFNMRNGIRKYNLSSVSRSEYLEKILCLANKGILKVEMIEFLMETAQVEESEAKDFIEDLIESQILVSDMEPKITAKNSLDRLILELDDKSLNAELFPYLRRLQIILRSPKKDIKYFQEIEKIVEENFHISKNILQTDLFLSSKEGQIEESIIKKINNQIEELSVLSRAPFSKDIEDFKSRFIQKYTDGLVPLALALDPEYGLGYSYLSDNLMNDGWIDQIPMAAKAIDIKTETIDFLKEFTLSKYSDYIFRKKDKILITDDDISMLNRTVTKSQIPASLFVVGSLFSQNGKLNVDKFFFDLLVVAGPSAANILARFAYGDEKLEADLKAILEKEESDNPDVIYAEIVHLPQEKSGNVLQRPILRKYEIPYLGGSGTANENQIHIDDLYISVKDNELFLYSRTHNKRVIPRLSSAHNYNFSDQNLPLYKFLCDLQNQKRAFIWDWGILGNIKHLPRVEYKNIIISKEQWIIHKDDIFSSSPDANLETRKYLKKLGLPNKVVVVESDEELILDLESDAAVEVFLSFFRNRDKVILRECLYDGSNSILEDVNHNQYVNQIVIPISHCSERLNPVNIKSINYYEPPTKFYLDDDWLYFKIYGNEKELSALLTNEINNFLQQDAIGQYEKFFFIRFEDPQKHLRIRFLVSKKEKREEFKSMFLKRLFYSFKERKIEKITLECYEREDSRYNKSLIDFAETFFYNDSVFVLKFLKDFYSDIVDYQYYYLIMRNINELLNDFEMDLRAKHHLLKILQNNFFLEFGGSKILQKTLNNRYSQFSKEIISFMDSFNDLKNGLQHFKNDLYQRTIMNKKFIPNLLHGINSIGGNERNSLNNLLSSFIHMTVNRSFSSSQRKHEMIIYHLLERYYFSLLARKKIEVSK